VNPPRDELVAEVIVALTDKLREDFDVADMRYTLTTACVELLDVDEAGMLLVDDEGRLVPVAATHDGSDHLERLQILVREGPCLDAVRADEPVYSLDLDGDQDAERWPAFTRQARAEGFRAAHAEAVALRGEVVGGLNLFRREPGPVPAADRRIAHFLATAAAVGILHRRAQRNAETVTEQLEHALTSRIVVEQAKGFLAERRRTPGRRATTRSTVDDSTEMISGGLPVRLPLKARHIPARLATGAFILNSGLEKSRGDEQTAQAIHGMASGTYPFLRKLTAAQFLRLLSTSEIVLGAALLLPVVPTLVAAAGLAAFSGGLLGLYLRTPGMRQDGGLRPTQQGTAIAKDVWMLGIAAGFVLDEIIAGKEQAPTRTIMVFDAASDAPVIVSGPEA
jgi:uncharacterized membrane protein YphA (DoxX/SURF4 family)